jgi:hypothetical protein
MRLNSKIKKFENFVSSLLIQESIPAELGTDPLSAISTLLPANYDEKEYKQTGITPVGQRRVCYLTERELNSKEVKEKYDLLMRIGFELLDVEGEYNPKIIYHKSAKDNAMELKEIADKYDGFLHHEATDEETRRIGELLEYDEADIVQHLKKRKAIRCLQSKDKITLQKMAMDIAREHEYSTGEFPPQILKDTLNKKVSGKNFSFLVKVWKMPLGIPEKYIEILLLDIDDEIFIMELYEHLVNINDELKVNQYKSHRDIGEMWHVIRGCCSRMTLDDITDYIENKTQFEGNHNFQRADGSSAEYTELYKKVSKVCVPPYFPSISNLKKICKIIEN